MNIEIANRLVNLRKQNNLSQEALAEKLGISRQAVSKWERAEASPDTDNLILLARLYGVSLDELLQTEDEIPRPDTAAEEGCDDAPGSERYKEEGSGTAEDGSGFQNGEESAEGGRTYEYGRGSNVHIGKDGIHVMDGEDEVHIDWHGIHVQEGSGDSVKVGWDGIHIREDGEEVFSTNRGRCCKREPKLYFPIGLIVCIAYLLVGIFYQAWHPGWLLFFLIPIFESLVKAVERRNASRFAYPMVTILFFLALGIFTGNWMGWIAFLTIPLYYSLVSYIKSVLRHRRWKKQQREETVNYREAGEEE